MEAATMPSGETELHTESSSNISSVSVPSNETDPQGQTTTSKPKVNGEINGSSAGEDGDTSPETCSTPPPRKRARNCASSADGSKQDKVLSQKAVSDSSSRSMNIQSPIVVELSSDVDSPVKLIKNSVKHKLDYKTKDKQSLSECEISASDSKDNNDTGEHKNGELDAEVLNECSQSSDSNLKNKNDSHGVSSTNGDTDMEVEEIKQDTSVQKQLSDDDEITELKCTSSQKISTDKKHKEDSSGDTDIEEIQNDTKSVNESEGSAKNGKEKSNDGEDLKTPTGSPDKQKIQEARRKSAEAKKQALLNITPRRSSRNLNKTKKYVDGESEPDEPDIEEILPVDPLAVSASERVRLSEKDPLAGSPDKEASRVKRKNTIIVNDTKALAQIAASSKEGKKEPTLVIIDTNSILSGRGPVPVSTPPSLPAALPAQGIYPIIHPQPAPPLPPPKQLLPPPPKPKGPVGLTDDMYVVEAPSFIVPYVYEKPPKEPLKEVVEKMAKILREEEKKEREEKAKEKKRKEKEKERKEKENKEKEKESKEKENKEKENENKEKENVNKEKEDSTIEKEKSVDDKDVKIEEVAKESENKDSEQVSEKKEEKEKTKKEDQVSDKDDEEPKADHDSDYKADSTKDKDSEEEDVEYDSESDSSTSSKPSSKPKSGSYFDSPLGKFFMQIGVNLVQEHVQTDLLRMQKRKLQRGGASNNPETQLAVHSLLKNLEQSKENNKPYKFEIKKCKFCNFKTESNIVLAHHLEMPHLRNFMYHCNFCPVALRTNHDILFHMEAEHNVSGRIERAPAFHQCPNCPFEDNQKSKMNRHMLSCTKRFRPERNCEPPAEWEPPAKIPRMSKNYRTVLPGSPAAASQQYMNQRAQGLPQHPLLPKLPSTSMMPTLVSGAVRGRGRPSVTNRFLPDLKAMPRAIAPSQLRQGMLYQQPSPRQQVLVPTSYQIAGNQIYQRWSQQVVGGQSSVMPTMTAMPRLTLMPHSGGSSAVALVPSLSGSSSNSITIQSASGKSSAAKLLQQPSISITPLPRQPSSSNSNASPNFSHLTGKQGQVGGKNSFVICEICDGYIKDLEQLRNHMQWIHKVKIHPKMIYNRPPLNCQKCQFRFFTDQGLERHLLGSHGLVTSSMQEASNKGKDGGRCPVCGRVYQWKLLNHVAKDHNMTLKPAHLSYKCTVCTATFGMYKQFENHVYSAHSVVAKRVMDKKSASNSSSPGAGRDTYSHAAAESLLKPLKINDEITIIPQPPKASSSAPRGGNHRKAPCQADDSGSENSL